MTLQAFRAFQPAYGFVLTALAVSLVVPAYCNQTDRCEAHLLPMGAMFTPTSGTTGSLTVASIPPSSLYSPLCPVSELGNPQADETIKLPPPPSVVAGDVV